MIKRYKIKFYGIVQGVGFRPFIFRLAHKFNLTGFVKNLSDSVLVEIQGEEERLKRFLKKCKKSAPPISEIVKILISEIPVKNEKEFLILPSAKNSKISIHIPPDIAICDHCIKELFNPEDRRYYYPFINCTNCGPRLTIIKDIPYDRINTSMSKFEMCEECKKEYEDPYNRRFHAEPIACHRCGPQIKCLVKFHEQPMKFDNVKNVSDVKKVINKVVNFLKKGKIVAIKGLGGFHLSCDATNNEAVEKLRNRKLREEKPFALMVKDFNSIEKIAFLKISDKKILKSPEAPILLIKKKRNSIIAENVAPGLNYYGIMLPYTPLHYLILDKIPYLVMTSGNITDEPICLDNNESFERLRNIADCFLIHNRDILVRCDDSICVNFNKKRLVVRRARGFSPKPIILKKRFPIVLGLGGHMKSTICILKENFAFLSPHIGDLDTKLSRDFFKENIKLMQKITEVNPEVIAVDMHPNYYSTQFAEKYFKNKKIIKVQHHHAHIVSSMIENNLNENVIGIALDGTGYGLDGNIWGGEILVCNLKEFKRVINLKEFLLLGGESAIKEIYRIAIAFIFEIFKENWNEIIDKLNIPIENIKMLKLMYDKKINSVYTSSAGRIFDAVSSIIGLKHIVNFDAQGAMLLEALSYNSKKFKIYPFSIKNNKIDFFDCIKEIIWDKIKGKSFNFIAKSFHFTFINAFCVAAEIVREREGLNKVVLSGGCFQNRILLQNFVKNLRKRNFNVYYNSKVPLNDGGLSLGQAIVASNFVI